MKMVFHIVLRQTRAKFDMLSICTCSYRALNLMMQSPSPVANQVLLGPKTTQRTHPRWEDMSVESFQGAVPLGVGDIGGRVFSLHKDKIRRILLFLDKIAVGDLPLALPARAMSPPSEYDAVAAAEGALLFKSCSQCSTSCLSSPSTTLVAPLPSPHYPGCNLSRASLSNSLTTLNVSDFPTTTLSIQYILLFILLSTECHIACLFYELIVVVIVPMTRIKMQLNMSSIVRAQNFKIPYLCLFDITYLCTYTWRGKSAGELAGACCAAGESVPDAQTFFLNAEKNKMQLSVEFYAWSHFDIP